MQMRPVGRTLVCSSGKFTMQATMRSCRLAPGAASVSVRPAAPRLCVRRPKFAQQAIQKQACTSAEFSSRAALLSAALTAPSMAFAQALADEVAVDAAPGPPISLSELTLLLAPVVLYAIFTVYRTQNPGAKISDFAFAVVTLAILGNVFSILVLKIRWF